MSLEVVRGGFATGEPAAGGPLDEDEAAIAERLGIDHAREALFAYFLSDEGMAVLANALESGRYRVRLPEECVLLVVAWLLRSGDLMSALDLLEQVRPFAGQLRFSPRFGDTPAPEPSVVWRVNASDVRNALTGRRPNAQIEAMREALLVWNPFADELLKHWLATADERGRVAAVLSDAWQANGSALLHRYIRLASVHTRCTKHRRPKENLSILIVSLSYAEKGHELTPRQRGLLQHAVESMVAKRGTPGSDSHQRLRTEQIEVGSQPTTVEVAQVVASRVARLVPEDGLADPDALLGTVTEAEGNEVVPAGAQVPQPICRVVNSALSASPERLLEEGVVPSAEVLASLVPRIAAATTSEAYGDESLRRLMAANYEAFRRRRSLLLLNLGKQVQLDELPWVRAVVGRRVQTTTTEAGSRRALVRLADLALQSFPGVLVPNPLVAELNALAKDGNEEAPFVEELGADIFMGRFAPKFLGAARIAAGLLGGTLYERYYGIDYRQVLSIDGGRRNPFNRTHLTFDYLCALRAETAESSRSPAANGKVIEQAQILTTHNLALLVKLGAMPSVGWDQLAWRAVQRMFDLLIQVEHARRPLPIIKNAAYAWRQAIFFLSLVTGDREHDMLARAEADLRRLPEPARQRVRPVLLGLRQHVDIRTQVQPTEVVTEARTFTGWATGSHWMAPRRHLSP